MKTSLHKDTYCSISQNKKRECVRLPDKNEHRQNFEKNELIGNSSWQNAAANFSFPFCALKSVQMAVISHTCLND